MRFRPALIVPLALVGAGAALYRAGISDKPFPPDRVRYASCQTAGGQIEVTVRTVAGIATVAYGGRIFQLQYRNTWFIEDRYDGPGYSKLLIDPEIKLSGFPDLLPQTCPD